MASLTCTQNICRLRFLLPFKGTSAKSLLWIIQLLNTFLLNIDCKLKILRLTWFNTHSHSLRVDGQEPPKSERLSILTPFPNQVLSEVLYVPSALTSAEQSSWKSYHGPPNHEINAKSCENRQNQLQHPQIWLFVEDKSCAAKTPADIT